MWWGGGGSYVRLSVHPSFRSTFSSKISPQSFRIEVNTHSILSISPNSLIRLHVTHILVNMYMCNRKKFYTFAQDIYLKDALF